MYSIVRSTAQLFAIASVSLLLAACGSGGNGGDNAATPLATSAVAASTVNVGDGRVAALGVIANGTEPATTLTVRAHGSLAGNIGPLMSVLVNGVIVGTSEVRAGEPTDYTFQVPPMKAGSKVDVVFGNDATIDGAPRDLFVDYLVAGSTFAVPTSPGVTYDVGSGAAAFDGVGLRAGQAALVWNGALRFTWPAPNMTDRLTVRASGTIAAGIGPLMKVQVDGIVVGSVEVRSTEPDDYLFAIPPLKVGSKVDVLYTNDELIDGVDRNLAVFQLMAGKTVLRPTAAGVVLDLGSGTAALDGLNVQPGQSLVGSNGALRIRWPAANLTDTITVRGSGTSAGGVGPVMQLRVDGVVLGTTEVRSTEQADYRFAAPPLLAGSVVEVIFTNDDLINGADRNLAIAYVIAGRTFMRPTAAGVEYDLGRGATAIDGNDLRPGQNVMTVNGAMRFTWPVPNMTETLTVQAQGTLAGNVGPQMQVRVDGVIVGSVEVRSTQATDFHFPAPPLAKGSKVDVVFTNDATLNGADRTLQVHYLISGGTYVLPTAPWATYDRGSNSAAFDGVDLLGTSGTLDWNGALRLVWPAPNITDAVTVRASGSLAANVGPTMQLRVDGVTFGSIEVRSPTPTDYVVAVPPLRAGSKLDVVFANDAIVDGADRNLYVAYLMSGATLVTPSATSATYDHGIGPAAFDGTDVDPGQTVMSGNGALRLTWPAPNMSDSITVRASANLAGNVGAKMQVRVNGVVIGTVEVRAASPADYAFTAPRLAEGSKVDIAYVNDETVNGQDRNLFIRYMTVNGRTLLPVGSNVQFDSGFGEAAFDGKGTAAGSDALYTSGALRFTLPSMAGPTSTQPSQYAAAAFLQQATFGPNSANIARLSTLPFATWLTEQMAIAPRPDYVNYVQGKYDLGDDFRPKGSQYRTGWVEQRFWANAATSPDQLRQRVAWALHQIFMVSQAEGSLHYHTRAYASYLDTLNRDAFGNFRTLLEDVALSPAMGLYLSHMRNRKEDPITGRMPDENFAREVMQLFTIGLHELNQDGTPKVDADARPIETYNNNDVVAMAKVFTGWSWAYPDSELTESNFRYGNPDYSSANDRRIDISKMKPYPGQHSQAEKRLFSGKASAVVIPANSTAQESLRIALDALFRHPNVGPFIGRQLIQRLVSSNPSREYVARVAAAFNNNGQGVRGDLSAVVRAVLLDSEARTPPAGSLGKLREPVLRLAHWMRSFDAVSSTGEFMMSGALSAQSQRAMNAPSVFGYYRPGYVPPNTGLSASGSTVPEFQIVNESTTAAWANMVMAMTTDGVGWTGTDADVRGAIDPLATLATTGNVDGMIEHINLLLFAGRMSSALKLDLIDAITGVSGSNSASHQNRARIALFLALASPEYMVQR